MKSIFKNLFGLLKIARIAAILFIVIILHTSVLYFFAINFPKATLYTPPVEVQLLPTHPVKMMTNTKPISKKKRKTVSKSSVHNAGKKVASVSTVATTHALMAEPLSATVKELLNEMSIRQQENNELLLLGKKSEVGQADNATDSDPNGMESSVKTAQEGEAFSLPPSMRITYTSYINGVRNQVGTIEWQTDGEDYRLHIAIPLPFVGVFTYRSDGQIDNYGLAPQRYEEARGKRAPVATNFNRDERQTISFSRVTSTFPLQAGAQDRFSVLWQLVALARGAPDKVTFGATRTFYVADTDQVEQWQIQALQEEDIPGQQEGTWIRARHFLRLPRRPGDERKLEVWLAENLGWIPVKLRQTEPSGNVLELVLKSTELIKE